MQRLLMHGTTDEDEAKYGVWFEGVIPNLDAALEEHDSEYVKDPAARLPRREQPCTACKGAAAAAGGDGRDRRRQEHPRI